MPVKTLKRRLREYTALLLRALGSDGLRLCARLPRVGTFAEALALHRQPFCKPLPATGSLLAWPDMERLDAFPTCQIPVCIQYAHPELNRAKKVAILAHWDPDQHVAPYVLHYAAAINRLGYQVILASAAAPRLDGAGRHFAAVVYRTCQGYDFTSWKAALQSFPALYQCEELLLVNDSVFAPISDLAPLCADMAAVDCDFWGVLESHAIHPHLQSWWLIFRKNTLAHPAFKAFWEQVRPVREKSEAVRQETRLGAWLQQHGLRGASRFPQSCFRAGARRLNPSHYAWDKLLATGRFPFLKRELLFENPYAVPLTRIPTLLHAAGYPLSLLTDYARRTNLVLPFNPRECKPCPQA